MRAMQDEADSQATFQKLKLCCVPLLGNSQLDPSSMRAVSNLLIQVLSVLRDVHSAGNALKPSLISYVFFPLSSILRRNTLSSIPDQILEKIIIILGLLCEDWWWEFDETTWEQIFMLSGAILGEMDSKGKGKTRDDETKEAAAICLWSLLRGRSTEEDPAGATMHSRATRNFSRFQSHAQTLTFIPVLGQTVNSLTTAAESPHLPLQRASLKVLHVLIECYLPDKFVPSVLPGVVSLMSKVALGVRVSKGWANGEIAAAALSVVQVTIVRAIGDDVCVRDGAVRGVENLEDLAELVGSSEPDTSWTTDKSPYVTPRTSAWLRGTASQLHIAMNALTPLVKHPTPSALLSLADFSDAVLSATTLTLPQSQPLLLSLLLSLSVSTHANVSRNASAALRKLLAPPSSARFALLQELMQLSRDNLAALPRLILTQADAKVEHAAGLLESVCLLATAEGKIADSRSVAIAAGVGRLLGPNGGIEKWGWGLLSVLQFVNSPVLVASSGAQLLLDADVPVPDRVPFPDLELTHVTSHSARSALERMFRSMGLAAGDDCIFAIEWFMSVGLSGRGREAVAALWCACRLLEGVARVSLDANDTSDSFLVSRSKRVNKLARGISRRIADTWMSTDDDGEADSAQSDHAYRNSEEDHLVVKHTKGLLDIRATQHFQPSPAPRSDSAQPGVHRTLCLQMIALTAGVLEARFTPLLLHTLYPILHSIVSDSHIVSITAMAALSYVTRSTSYASPANLLLSNFDYALDAVSRRLSRRWLDVDSTKVLIVLVRLVGREVVQKAGDVVEECFDRLDEYHGYEVVVDGLVEVLTEVVKVIEDDEAPKSKKSRHDVDAAVVGTYHVTADSLLEWYVHRHDSARDDPGSNRDSSYPREAWRASVEGELQDDPGQTADPNAEPPATPSQALIKQIVSRSLYFLTHGSPMIRARILTLLSSAVPVLPESALLPSIHYAWPFILNRLADQEPFVVSSAASLIESLAIHVGDFMHQRIWDEVWPRFRAILETLIAADRTSALARRGRGAVGTDSAYTHSHRMYRSLLRTMTAAISGVPARDSAMWEVILLFRRFLHAQAHEELQACARDLYSSVAHNNQDAVWLVLSATSRQIDASVAFLTHEDWDIESSTALIFANTS